MPFVKQNAHHVDAHFFAGGSNRTRLTAIVSRRLNRVQCDPLKIAHCPPLLGAKGKPQFYRYSARNHHIKFAPLALHLYMMMRYLSFYGDPDFSSGKSALFVIRASLNSKLLMTRYFFALGEAG